MTGLSSVKGLGENSKCVQGKRKCGSLVFVLLDFQHADARRIVYDRECRHVAVQRGNNNNVHLSCAHQHPERSHDTY